MTAWGKWRTECGGLCLGGLPGARALLEEAAPQAASAFGRKWEPSCRGLLPVSLCRGEPVRACGHATLLLAHQLEGDLWSNVGASRVKAGVGWYCEHATQALGGSCYSSRDGEVKTEKPHQGFHSKPSCLKSGTA